MTDDQNELKRIISLGAETIGSTSGAAIGFILGGPVGAAVGGVLTTGLSHTLRNIGEDVSKRYLSQTEKKRVGSILVLSASKIEEKIKNGKTLRDDGFFDKTSDDRSAGEEITEGIIRAAQTEHEELKNSFYANLLVNIAFDESVDKAEANSMLKIAERLTYRDLCILRLAAAVDKSSLRQESYRDEKTLTFKLVGLLTAIYSLYSQGLINFSANAALGIGDVEPGKIQLQGVGIQLFHLMELNQIPLNDLLAVGEMLKK